MPKAMTYLPPDDKVRHNVMLEYENEYRARKDVYDTAYRYYTGKHPEQLDKKENEPDDNAVINKVRQVVDRTLSFLFPSFPSIEVDPNNTEISEEERWLYKAWAANGGIALLQKMTIDGAFGGQVYVRVRPVDVSIHPYPRVVLLNPLTVQTWWRADDIERILWHEIRWEVDTDEYVQDFINMGTAWEIIQYRRSNGGRWEVEVQETWPYPYGPIVSWQYLPDPHNYYGMAEFTASQFNLNDKINLIASETNRINRYHSSPKTIATGAAGDEIQETGIDELWAIENPDAKVYNLEMKSDMAASVAHYQRLEHNFLAESRTVILEGNVKDFQRVTNAGVRTVFLDQLSKNTILRWNFGKGIQAISRLLFLLNGMPDVEPDVVHNDPLPVDDLERINVASVERSMGIASRQTLAKKRGYNWDVEIARMVDEATNPAFNPVATNANASATSAPQVMPQE